MTNRYSIGKFEALINRRPRTHLRQEGEGEEGILIPKRLPSGHRFYEQSDLDKILSFSSVKKLTVVYCRESSVSQKVDLKHQREPMERWALSTDRIVDEWIEEVGGALNFQRPLSLKVTDRIIKGEVRGGHLR